MKRIISFFFLVLFCTAMHANTFLSVEKSVRFDEPLPKPKAKFNSGNVAVGGSFIGVGGALTLLSSGIGILNVRQGKPEVAYISLGIGMLGTLFMIAGGIKISKSVSISKEKPTTFNYGVNGSGFSVGLSF